MTKWEGERGDWNGPWDREWEHEKPCHTEHKEHKDHKDHDKDCEHNELIKEQVKTKSYTTRGRAETVIHKPSPIVVKQPPTQVTIHHAPLLVHPSPVVFHRSGATIHRPVTHEQLPRKVEERLVHHTIVKPIVKSVLVDKKGEKPTCDQEVIVDQEEQRGCEKQWIENGEAYAAEAGSVARECDRDHDHHDEYRYNAGEWGGK